MVVERKGNFNKEMLVVLTATEAQKNLIQDLLKKWTNMDETVIRDVSSQVLTISASQGVNTSTVCEHKANMNVKIRICRSTWLTIDV